MIPRFVFDFQILRTLKLLLLKRRIIEEYEYEFAQTIGVTNAVAYPYGRTALLCAIEVLGIRSSEIIVPAYTCSVVAHSVFLSGNKVRFCDVENKTFNIDLISLDKTISKDTCAIIVTNNFGQSVNQELLGQLIRKHEAINNKKIYLIQDCAYAFDAKWNGSNICNIGDITIYGTNISKSVTSIFGGMLSTRHEEFYYKAREWQKNRLVGNQKFRNLRRLLYALTAKYALKPGFFNLTYILITKTKWLNKILNSYHKDDVIAFPPDAFNKLSRIEAATGLISIKYYDKNKKNRKELARRYSELTRNIQNWNVINFDEGSNPSHFPIEVSNKNHLIRFFAERGVQIGEVIEYSIPHTNPYKKKITEQFPTSLALSKSVINLPLNWEAFRKIKLILLDSESNNYTDLC